MEQLLLLMEQMGQEAQAQQQLIWELEDRAKEQTSRQLRFEQQCDDLLD